MSKFLWACVVVCFVSQSAFGAELTTTLRRHGHHIRHVQHWHGARAVLEETHVVEVALDPPAGRRFIINGAHFTATGNACLGWAPRQRLRLLAGEWHGYCHKAVFQNLTLRRVCEMWCW